MSLQNNTTGLQNILGAVNNLPPSASVVCYVSTSGSDSNDGLSQSTALATLKKALELGFKTIAVESGEYFITSGITLSGLGGVHIYAYYPDESYAHTAPKRAKVKITGATYYSGYTKNSDGVYQQSGVTAGFDYAAVFTNKSKTALVSTKTTGHSTYHANLMVIHDDISKDYYLRPVLTYAECVSTADSFYWEGSTLYFNTASSSFVKVAVIRSEVGLTISNCNNITMDDICFGMVKGNVVTVNNSNDIVFNNCEANASALYNGFAYTDVNGVLNNCCTTKNGYDGFNFHGYGTTVMNDCTAENNYDDGCSHHDGCIGTINGGKFYGSGKAGIAPAYGAIVNIYNAICEANRIGIGYLSTTNGHAAMKGNMFGCALINNAVGLQVDALCSVVAVSCCYLDNSTDKTVNGTLVELGSGTGSGGGSEDPGMGSEYTELQYIETDGGQYIDTGIEAAVMASEYTKGIRYEISGLSPFSTSGNNYMFGALDSGKTCRSGNLTYNNGTIGFYCGSGTAISTGANTAMQNTEFSITVQGTPLDYTQTKLTLEYGDVIKTPSDGSNTQVSSIPDGLNIWLFQVNGASGAYAGKLYSFKMTGIKADNTEVVLRNYKPCLKSDGAIGLYDTVSGAFFTNDGTGSFTAGAEV